MNGTVREVVTQNGQASAVKEIWNFSPGIVRICPSNTDGNLVMISSTVGIPVSSTLVVGVLGIDRIWSTTWGDRFQLLFDCVVTMFVIGCG